MKKKVVILGGGVSGCSAAYWLTRTPELREKYEVTLYQMGWRMGGKGASGRNPEKENRSEEHGPHVWFGGYDNAVRMLRGCYTKYFHEYGSHGPYTKMLGDGPDAAFLASKEAAFIHEQDGQQHVWKWNFPEYNGTPGDGTAGPKGWELLWRLVDIARDNVRSHPLLSREYAKRWGGFHRGRSRSCARVAGAAGVTGGDGFDALIEAIEHHFEDVPLLRSGLFQGWKSKVAKVLIERLQALNTELLDLPHLPQDAIKVLQITDCFYACALAWITEIHENRKAFEDLDTEDFQDLLERYGAVRGRIEQSAFLRGYYDTAFAYPEGGAASFGAGTGLRAFLWVFFGYKGAYVYKMQGGMGEIVFTPLYNELKKHVDIRFFHRVDNIQLSADKTRIESLKLNRQANLKAGVSHYNPLQSIPWKDSPPMECWLSRPDYSQLAPGSEPPPGDPGYESPWTQMKGEEVVVSDFDEVILAIPVSSLPHIAPELIDASPQFAEMATGLRTVRTIASQLWLTDTPNAPRLWENLGFTEPILSCAAKGDWDIWMDYSATLKSEQVTNQVRHLLYGCGVMPDSPEPAFGTDPGYPASVRAAKRVDLHNWLQSVSPELWKRFLKTDGSFDWDRLYAENGVTEEARMEWQYVRTNIEPTERYTTPAADTVQFRRKAGESGFENLILAGDWIKNGIDIGCVEAATISGMQAVEALTGEDLGIVMPSI